MEKQTKKSSYQSKAFKVSDSDFRTSSWTKGGKRCVQIANKGVGVAVRDSKDSRKTTLFFNRGEWDAFIKGVKDGQFDLL